MQLTKVCKCCGKKKSVSEFLESGKGKRGDGLHNWCFDCMAEKTLVCATCGEVLTIDKFSKSAGYAIGYMPSCKSCINKAAHGEVELKKHKRNGCPVPRVAAPRSPQESRVSTTTEQGLTLNRVSTEDLLKELKHRGYTGKLQLVKEVSL